MTPERRERINRLKRIILQAVVLMIVLPVSGCIFLGVKLNRASGAVRRLAERVIYLEKVLQDSADEQNRTQAILRVNKGIEQRVPDAEEYVAPQGAEETQTTKEAQETENRKVYLTFDDGPSVNTGKLLDILAEYDVKATFFVLGKGKARYSDMYRRIVEEGHTLGMHSYSHEYRNIYASIEGFQKDLGELRELLYRETGVVSRFYRFPGGTSNAVSSGNVHEFISYLNAMDIAYFDWNLSAGDATTVPVTSDQIVEQVMRGLPAKRVAVVLMHDAASKGATVEALPKLIEAIRALDDGTEILPITDETPLIQHVSAE